MSERHENPASVSGTDQAQRPTRQLTGDGSDRAGGRRSVAGERDSGLAAGHPPASVARALCDGEHADPFALLGAHRCSDGWCVRALGLDADELALELEDASRVPMQRVDATSLFVASGLEQRPARYRLWSRNQGGTWCHEDPYRFSSPLGPLDLHLMAEGTHLELYERFGARLLRHEGVEGVHFCVWAPNARRVSVVGPFNGWDGRRHVMRQHPGAGVWDLFVPGLHAGELYKFEILAANGRLLPLKADPFARRMEPPPGNACIVEQDEHVWGDAAWMAQRPAQSGRDRPVAIYEVHVGSWRRHQPDGRPYSYDELAESLIPYVLKMGFTHIELLPISEHPFDGSWGYQPIGLFAPTWRHGSPQACKRFIDRCHQAGVGVIMDWVPAHFPRDAHGLGLFDGTHLYEHADPRRGAHQDWGTLIFNYGRREVSNYLLASALYWIREFHVDALRVDAVASMLYLDYSRAAGEWLPNEHGGNENLDAVRFLQRLNQLVHAEGAISIAEESTAWPQVSRPVEHGGLGFSYKWNMGWMHDTLSYMGLDPVHRRYHHDKLTFGLLYAFSENFVLPLSHDEVVHGKRSLLDRMPGDGWQRFANLRLLYALMYAYPGKKLLFMGDEFGQGREWNHNAALDWDLLERELHQGVATLVGDVNHLYRSLPALHRLDNEPAGFEWIDCDDRDNSVIAFTRRAADAAEVVVVCNFTPVVRHGYRIGMPRAGRYAECLNSDARQYAGRGIGNLGAVQTEPVSCHGHAQSVELSLPPLGALWFVHEPQDER